MERRSNKTGDSSLSDPPAPPKRVASGLTIDIPSIISGDGSGGVEPTRQEPALDKSMYAMLTSDFTEKTLTKTKEERKDIIVNPSPHSDSTSPTAPRGTPGKEQGAGFEESRTAPRDAFSTSSDDEEEGDEGAEDPMSIMKRVLKEAAQPKGFRLTWILYSMIFIVIAFFVMLLIQTTFTMNSALKTGGKQSVQALASSTVNNVKLTLYELDKLFDTVDLINSEENDDMSLPTPIASIIYSTLCTRLFGAPQNILNYEENSSTANWALPCNSAFKPPTVDLFKQAVYSKEIRLAGLSDNNTMAYRFGNLTSRSAVVLSKDLLGKGLFSNDVPKYSTGVLQSAFVGLFLAQWNNTTPSIVMHTLNEETASYADPQPTKEGERLQKAFNTYCQHTNEYTWYNVIRPKVFSDDEFDFDSENSSTFHPIPSPYQELKGRWGLLSRSVLCVAVCIDDYDSICRPENPSTMWLVIDYEPSSMGQDAVQYVGIISIVALVIFSILAVFDYISITIPVDYLRDQLLRIVGPRRDHSSCFKRMVRWSYRLWLGDLKALIRTLHILRFCYEHNQKYVPEHILMRQANELYQNRSKLFLLYKMELRYDAGILEDDEESDNELVEDKPNERADSTMWTNLDNEMTTVSMQNSLNISNFREDLLSSPDPNISDNGDRDANPSNYLSSVKRGVKPPMTIKRSDEATVLCIQFVNIENAYSVNYNLAVKQHRRLMRYTLSQIRKYKGVIFHRTGDCMAVVWNGFNVCSAHTEKATECAISFAASFAPYREQGFQVGIVVHKGSFVCGVVEDSKEAFITAFGEAPSQAITLATLAAMQPYFGFIVTEPAKQALSSVYDFGVIDVIKMPAGTHSMYLFEIIGKKDKKATRADFLVQYTKAFTKFRNHEFHDSLEGIRQLRKNFPKQSDVLVHRLELLCQYYSRHKSDIPRPYVRAYPAWENYDQRAQITGPECYYGTPLDQPGSATLVYEVPEVFKEGAPYNDHPMNFREELQLNVRRLGSPGVNGKHMKTNSRASPTASTGGDASGRGTPQSPATSRPAVPSEVDEPEDEMPATPYSNVPVTVVSSTSQSLNPVEAFSRSGTPQSPRVPTPQTPAPIVAGADQKRLDMLPMTSAYADPVDLSTSKNPSGPFERSILLTSANQLSLIQSVGLTAGGTEMGQFTLPTEVEAKNGIVYTRSARLLGKGSFGEVYLGMEMLSGKLVAMKFMPIPFDEADIDGIEAEVSIMQRVKGAYVVELITYAFAGDTILLVMECMMAGSLQNMISAFHVISNVTARVFMRDVLRGLSRLHSYGIIHRDVKPQNVLLTLSGTCKISDFGASTWLQRLVQKEYQGVVQGTPVYLAPEAARGITEMASDLWSCGIMYLQLITGHLPYPKEKLNLASPILVYQIGSGQAVPVIPDDLDELDAAFVKSCLQTDAEKRSTAEKLLQMPLFVL